MEPSEKCSNCGKSLSDCDKSCYYREEPSELREKIEKIVYKDYFGKRIDEVVSPYLKQDILAIIETLQAENDRLNNDRGADNASSSMLIESLKREVEELRSPIKLSERLCKPYEDEIESLKKSIAEVSQERDVEIRRARIAEAKLKEAVEVIKDCVCFTRPIDSPSARTTLERCLQFLENNK